MAPPSNAPGADAASRLLHAGALSAELENGNLRAIRWHRLEALRAIQFLVRDDNWGNIPLLLDAIDVRQDGDAFEVSLSGSCGVSGAVLRYQATIRGFADGRIVFEATAIPDGDFRTNRCGFCILHPIVGVAGTPVTIEHGDGSFEEARLPERIEPAQPFSDMRAITHQVAPGVTARCLMEGDVFEMEDQRNWTDASYKTYVRPLALPWPYVLQAGKPVVQRIELTLSGEPASGRGRPSADAPVSLRLGGALPAMPPMALVVSPETVADTLDRLDLLKASRAAHLILEFDPLNGHDTGVIAHYAALVDRSGLPATLEFVLPCRDSPHAECAAFAETVDTAGLKLASLAISPAPDLKSTPPGSRWPDCPRFSAVYAAARAAFPGMPLGGGMFSYFTELNRKRPPGDLIDFVTHTTSPIVHAADDRSVMETLEALPFVTGSVRAIYGDMPYRIGPSTIGMRHNPYGSRLNDNPAGERLTMTADDPRQAELFAAAWMVGYAASVADAGLDMLSLGALTGRFGLVGSAGLHPAFHAQRALGSLSGTPLRQVRSSDPSRVLALSNGVRTIVANLTPEAVDMDAPLHDRRRVLDTLSADTQHDADWLDCLEDAAGPLIIGAYGIAVLEGNGS